MKAAILMRPVLGSHQVSGTGGHSIRRSSRSALYLDAKERKIHPNLLRRARSDTDLIGSSRPRRMEALWSLPTRVAEEVVVVEEEDQNGNEIDLDISDLWSGAAVVVPEDEVDFSGGGMGKGRKIGRGRGAGGEGGNPDEKNRMGGYYQEMLRSDPGNPLLLRNYGRFLHEVERDAEGAEEYYGRAILANPGDGEVLSLYGKLVWEAHGDGARASGYFERAVDASPRDCYVLGSYANFLWEAEDDDEEGEEGIVAASSPLVEAF